MFHYARDARHVTIFPNEENRFGPFQGWGTSLAWWTNSYGNLTDEERKTIIRAFYDAEEGLGLTVVRYNIGGGDQPGHHHFYSPEVEAPCYLSEDGRWNFDVDRAQVSFLKEAVACGAEVVEAFANSPPWFMTVSGCSAGAENSNEDNLREDQVEAFADYLTEVVRYLESEGIHVETLAPFNEPNTEFWKKGGKQEGCHYSIEREIDLLRALNQCLAEKNLTSKIAAFDDNTLSKARENLERIVEKSPDALKNVAQINVHAYETKDADDLAERIEHLGKYPAMSELDVAHNLGENPPNRMGSALAFAEKIHDSFRILQPVTWSIFTVLPRESSAGPAKDSGYYSLARYFRGENRLEFFKKYYVYANYSKFIRPGFLFVKTDQKRVLSAKDPKTDQRIVVIYNEEKHDVPYKIDLGLDENEQTARTVKAFRTSPTEDLAALDGFQIKGSHFSFVAAPYSVTTLIVSGVSDSPVEKSSSEHFEADVVIYGGTSAAVSAAVQVRKMGKSVILVSPDVHLGGLSSSGLGATDSGVKSVIGGLSREFYHRVWRHYQNDTAWTFQKKPGDNGKQTSGEDFRGIDNRTETMWVFEPRVAEEIFDGFIEENKIDVYRGERLDRERWGVKEGRSIRSITTLSGKVFSGKMFIDATYEGDLLAAAGVAFTVGREGNARYNETLNGIQTKQGIYHQFEGPVDPYVERGNPASGLLPMVHPSAGGVDGSADDHLQAYCYRLCLTRVPENRIPFEKPADYSEADYELLFRSIEAGQNIFSTFTKMPNGKTDSNNNKAVSTDFIGQNKDYPEASYERRDEILASHTRWEKGLFWTLANHPRVPEKIRHEFSEWGLAKDEFTDNGGWPHQIYVREARRMVGEFVICERHLRRLDETPRSVGMGSYNMDSHHVQRYMAIDEDGRATVRNEGDVQVNPGAPYPIDYGALLPKATECDNLLVPVCVSCSHIAYGSIRMEPVFMILGQSAATAAVLSMEKNVTPQSLDYATLSERLIKDGQILESDNVWPER